MSDRVIIECRHPIPGEPGPADEATALHAAACVAVDGVKGCHVAVRACAPGMLAWVILGGTLQRVDQLQSWLYEHAPMTLDHRVMGIPLAGRDAPGLGDWR